MEQSSGTVQKSAFEEFPVKQQVESCRLSSGAVTDFTKYHYQRET